CETRASHYAQIGPPPWTTSREEETNGECIGVRTIAINEPSKYPTNFDIERPCRVVVVLVAAHD
ncbi:hypothetical protein KIN20_023468, partial [Parelaphostrongylus tenuis]